MMDLGCKTWRAKAIKLFTWTLALTSIWTLTALPLTFASSQEKVITLVENGKSNYQIIRPEKASLSVALAAREIQVYVKKTTGVNLEIVNQLAANKHGIFVGSHPDLPTEPRFDPSTYQKERFLIDNWNGNIVIMGAKTDLNPLALKAFAGNFGMLYGCYEFIERFLGVRWYAPGKLGETFPRLSRVEIVGLPIKQTAAYFSRTYYPWNFNENTPIESLLWYRHMKGIGSKTFRPNHTMLGFGNVYPKTEPEIFALDRDKKGRVFGKYDKKTKLWTREPQLCLTNPRTLDIYMQAVDKWYVNSPDKKKMWPNTRPNKDFVYVTPDDQFNLDPCHGDNCQAALTPKRGYQGEMSNLVWNFVDKVAKRVKEKYPDKMVGALAYEAYYLPPEELVLPDNVIARLCISPYLIYFGLPEYERRVDETLSEWRKHVKQMSVWQYYMPYQTHPYLSPHKMVQWYKRYEGFITAGFIELMDTFNDPRPIKKTLPNQKMGRAATDLSQVHLNMFFTMKALWGSDIDVDKELDRFYTQFFGPAQKPMKKFHELIIKQWETPHKEIKPLSTNVRNPPFMAPDIYGVIYTEEVLNKLVTYLKEAERLSPKKSIYATRLKWIHDGYFDQFQKTASGFHRQGRNYWALTQQQLDTPKPNIDGKFDDAIWANATSYDFLDTNGPVAPRFKTSFKLAVDQDHLYLAIHAQDPHWKSQRLTATHRDDTLWTDDSIELFFSPDVEKMEDFYQIIVNLDGQIFDQKKLNHKGDKTWTSLVVSKTKRSEGFWDMELSIPLKDFGINKINAGDNWGFNLCRNKKSSVAEQHERSQWSPTGGIFAAPKMFGRIFMVKDQPYISHFDNIQTAKISHGLRDISFDENGQAVETRLDDHSKLSTNEKNVTWEMDFIQDKDRKDYAFISFHLPKGGLDVSLAPKCEVKFRSPSRDTRLALTYSYLGQDGKTYSDYTTLTRAGAGSKWLIRVADFSKDGHRAKLHYKKTGKYFSPPQTLKFLALYGSVFSVDAPKKRIVELDYLRITGQAISDADVSSK